MLINLARGWRPLLRIPDASKLRLGHRTEVFEEWIRSPVALTDAGLRVVSGSQDQIQFNGIDRWLGGRPSSRSRSCVALGSDRRSFGRDGPFALARGGKASPDSPGNSHQLANFGPITSDLQQNFDS